MICDECLHKNVCKEIENFKEYTKQYEEMKKKSSLFDKPIECPCYMSEINDKGFTEQDIKNLEVINEFLKAYLDITRGMTFKDIRAFMITNETLEKHIDKLKLIKY